MFVMQQKINLLAKKFHCLTMTVYCPVEQNEIFQECAALLFC